MDNLLLVLRSKLNRDNCLLFALGLVYLVFLFPSPEYPILNKDDGALFLTLGINIAELGRYTLDTMVTPNYGLHATWPPVFPLYLATIIKLTGMSWPALKLGMVVLGLATLFVLWRLYASTLNGRLAVFLTALSPYFFLYSHHTMTEVPYMLVVTLTLLLLDKSLSNRDALLAGIIGAIAFLTRGYAVTLLPAGVLFFLLQTDQPLKERIKRACVFSLPLLVVILAWSGYTHTAIAAGNIDDLTARFGNGTDILAGLLRSPIEHLQHLYWHDVIPIFLMIPLVNFATVQQSHVLFALSAGLFILAGIGWLLSWRNSLSSVLLWLPITMGLLFAMQTPSARYWLPLLPYLFYFVLVAASQLSARIPHFRFFYHGIAGVLLITGMMGFILCLVHPERLRYQEGQEGQEAGDIALWAREHLPPNAVIVTRNVSDTYTAAHRRSFLMSKTSSWPPENLLNEPELFLLCPKDANLYPDTYNRCNQLLQQGQFVTYKETARLSLFRFSRY